MQTQNALMSLEEALDAAYQEEGCDKPQAAAPKEPRKFETTALGGLKWSNGLFGKVEIDVENMVVGPVEKGPLNAWAPIWSDSDTRPAFLTISVKLESPSTVMTLRSLAGKVEDVSKGVPNLPIAIEWNPVGEGRFAPHTREKDKDNFDLILLDHEGSFVVLQISATTQRGSLWLTCQEVYGGQIARTTHAKAEGLGVKTHRTGSYSVAVLPQHPENAYPGSDYLRTFSKSGPAILENAVRDNRMLPMSKCRMAAWAPMHPTLSPEMLAKGWKPAVVTFFNLVIGWGFALCEDGKTCYVHFKEIEGKAGQFRFLTSMRGIALKYTEDENGKRKATVIRAL